jgi:hypothetical protein
VSGVPKTDDNGEKIADPVTTAFRTRVMLFEFAVRKLFPSRNGDDFMELDIDDVGESTPDKAEAVVEKPKTRDIEEDNYDDEDEEEGTTAVALVPKSSTQDADSSLDNIGIARNKHANSRRHTTSPSNQIVSYRHILSHIGTRQSSHARATDRRGTPISIHFLTRRN